MRVAGPRRRYLGTYLLAGAAMTRDPDSIRGDLTKHAAADAMVSDEIARTHATIATKRAEIDALEYRVDMLLIAQERRRVAEDQLLDELLGASSEGVTAW